jgi:hypothetical protein
VRRRARPATALFARDITKLPASLPARTARRARRTVARSPAAVLALAGIDPAMSNPVVLAGAVLMLAGIDPAMSKAVSSSPCCVIALRARRVQSPRRPGDPTS